jgi:5-methylcytosine-specific restriction protein A
MADPGDTLSQQVDVLRQIVSRIPGGIGGSTCAQDAEIVELLSAAQSVVLCAQGILAAASGEVARRSAGANDASLARRLGERSARGLVAAKTGISFGEASRYVAVGEAIRPNLALSGETLPADRQHIAEAVLAGALPLSVAQLIDETIHKVAFRLELGQEVELEQGLVAEFLSAQHSIAQFTAHCAQVVEILDPDGTKPRDGHLRKKAYIQETWLPGGMLRIVAELDPERAAFYRAAVRAKTNPRRPQAATGGTESAADAPDLGTRRDSGQPSAAESKLDAFTRILRDSLKAEDGPQAGVDTTILVRIDLHDLLDGAGFATIDGIASPIPASAARRLAAEADVIPQVFDGKSQLLDQGESKRLFTKAQRYAILAAFTGCAFPKCDIPSSMVEFHHVGRWATRHQHKKGTDVLNGLPLCGFHNRLMEQGWEIRFDEQRIPWFLPPATVDFFQRPVRGGNLAHPLVA